MVLQKSVVLRGTVEDNIAYGLRVRDLPNIEVKLRVTEALESVGLRGFEDRNARGLSGGEKQRLSLARALTLGCDLLLLDEPTANLDPESLSSVKQIISWLNRETGTTIVMATHNLLQAEELSERFILLERGEVIEAGDPASILTTPSKKMARFARLENVFTGISRDVEGVSHISVGGGVEVKAAFCHSGRVTFHVGPEDIILSLDPVETSARNQLKGRISSIDNRGSVVLLKIDTGRVFTVQITRRSFVEMGLNLDSEVYISFKASSVQLM
jgi:molybdopterin-binding protein